MWKLRETHTHTHVEKDVKKGETEGWTYTRLSRILVIRSSDSGRNRRWPRNIRRKTRFQVRIDSNNAVAKRVRERLGSSVEAGL